MHREFEFWPPQSARVRATRGDIPFVFRRECEIIRLDFVQLVFVSKSGRNRAFFPSFLPSFERNFVDKNITFWEGMVYRLIRLNG